MSTYDADHEYSFLPEEPDFKAMTGRSIPLTGWRICFDAPPAASDSLRAEQGNILMLFRAWAATQRQLSAKTPEPEPEPDPERRESPRYLPAETNAWIGWWQGSRFIVSHTELVNLSRGGAQLLVKERPPTGQPVWVCLGAPHPIDYAQARVLDAFDEPGVPAFRVRMEFHFPCPNSFFFAAGHKAPAP